jgi:hypothetical protein
MLIFNGVGEALKNLRSRFAGSVLNLQGSLKEFSDIEDMLKQESSEFEVSFLYFFCHLPKLVSYICFLSFNSFRFLHV